MFKSPYYSLNKINKINAHYYIIFGERSNGKTYALLKQSVENYVKRGEQSVYLRRWPEDMVGKRGQLLFSNLVFNGEIKKLTHGTWTDVYYYASKWFLCRYEDNVRICDEKPLLYGMSISNMEHDKSISYPNVTTIIFDEFISRTMYLTDEFVLFENVLSTIIRDRNNVKIYMLGNTVNKYGCPYFREMGLTNIKNQKPGTIDTYKYGESGLVVAVEFTEPMKEGKQSDVYFAFNNPRLQMITGSKGIWEMNLYPHCPMKYRPKDIVFTYFIKYEGNVLQCEIISRDGCIFTFIHPKTTELKNTDHDLIFDTEYNPRPNYRRKITKPTDNITSKICEFFRNEKVFYSDNEVGEMVRNYVLWCASAKD